MRAKLLALLIGLLLIGTAFFFGSPAQKQAELPAEQEDYLTPAHSPVPRQKPGLFQTVSFHPSNVSGDALAEDRPVLNAAAAEVHWNSIASLVSCARDGKGCSEDLPDTDPSSKFFALRDRILDEADWFLAHQFSGGAQNTQMAKAVNFLLSIPDEEVQGKALDIALQAKVQDPALPAQIAQNMPDVVDSDNVVKASQVLRMNLDDSNVETVVDYACNTILHGATLASKEMAKQVPTLDTPATHARLEACMAKLPKGERYQSMQNGLYPPSAI